MASYIHPCVRSAEGVDGVRYGLRGSAFARVRGAYDIGEPMGVRYGLGYNARSSLAQRSDARAYACGE